MHLRDIQTGDTLVSVQSTGTGVDATYYRVLKVNRVTVRARSEYGDEGLFCPQMFDRKVVRANLRDIAWKTRKQ